MKSIHESPNGCPWITFTLSVDPEDPKSIKLAETSSAGWPCAMGYVSAVPDGMTEKPTMAQIGRAYALLISRIWEHACRLDECDINTTDRRMSMHIMDAWREDTDDGISGYCARCGGTEFRRGLCLRCNMENNR